MITLKITFGSETRRASIDDNATSFEAFLSLLTRLFQVLPPRDQYSIVYEDDDQDMVTISSDSELQDAIRLAMSAGWTSLRMSVKLKTAQKNMEENFFDDFGILDTIA